MEVSWVTEVCSAAVTFDNICETFLDPDALLVDTRETSSSVTEVGGSTGEAGEVSIDSGFDVSSGKLELASSDEFVTCADNEKSSVSSSIGDRGLPTNVTSADDWGGIGGARLGLAPRPKPGLLESDQENECPCGTAGIGFAGGVDTAWSSPVPTCIGIGIGASLALLGRFGGGGGPLRSSGLADRRRRYSLFDRGDDASSGCVCALAGTERSVRGGALSERGKLLVGPGKDVGDRRGDWWAALSTTD